MTIKDIFKSRKVRDFLTGLMDFLPNEPYTCLYYWATTGKHLNLKNPKGYNEKLNWLKMHGDYSKYTDYCDKIKVRKIIEEKLGDGYMFPLLGQWKSFEEIDFDSLPDEFVLKCNHDSGSTKIIQNKKSLTEKQREELRKFFNHRVNNDFYRAGREPCYKGIDRYIIAEPLMKNEQDNESIRDYKFLCFNGNPEIMYVNSDKSKQAHRDFFDMNFNHLDITNLYPQSDTVIDKPTKFDEMKEIVSILAKDIKDIKTVRIDLYEINGKIYFGEYTFFHCGGFCLFQPDEWEQRLGDLIRLP